MRLQITVVIIINHKYNVGTTEPPNSGGLCASTGVPHAGQQQTGRCTSRPPGTTAGENAGRGVEETDYWSEEPPQYETPPTEVLDPQERILSDVLPRS